MSPSFGAASSPKCERSTDAIEAWAILRWVFVVTAFALAVLMPRGLAASTHDLPGSANLMVGFEDDVVLGVCAMAGGVGTGQ